MILPCTFRGEQQYQKTMDFKNWFSSLKSCFSNNATIETVRIRKGDYNNSIPDFAFRGYSSLESVQIEDDANITTIGEGAFEDCSLLKSINIPIGVTIIGENAFRGCKSLQSIDIPIESLLFIVVYH